MTDQTSESLSENELCPNDLLKGQEEAFARDIAKLQARKNEFVTVSCPACNTEASTVAFTKFDFTYRHCDSCKMLYMSPRPSPELMDWYYTNSENYKYWAEHIFPASEDVRRDKIHKPWLEKITAYCKEYGVGNDLLLEIGPGFGTFSQLATRSGFFKRVVAVEPNPYLAEACRKRGIEVIEKLIEDVGDELPPANLAVCFEVIEHLFNPKQFLEQIFNTLKRGGLLISSCPNSEGFDISTLREHSLAVDAEHVNLFTPHSLKLLLEQCGFKVLSVSTPGRLDAEFVREAALKGLIDFEDSPFLKRVLIDEWETLGEPFQQFLAKNNLSSHLWMVSQRT